MANELVVFEEKGIVLPSTMNEALVANLGEDAEVTALNLPRVSLSSGMTRLEIPDPAGDVNLQDEVEMWPANVSPRVRRYYRDPYDAGETGPPDCWSVGGKTGVGTPGGMCKACPNNQWGSARQGDGKACGEYKYIYMMLPGLYLPVLLTVPPTSLKALQNYLLNQCALRNQAYWHTLARVSLKKGNTPAPELELRMLQVLPQESWEVLDKAHSQIAETFPIGGTEATEMADDTIDGTAQPVEEEPIDI